MELTAEEINRYQRMFYNQKHRSQPAALWRDFDHFVSVIGPRPSEYCRMVRPDRAQPWGPDNWEWRLLKAETNAVDFDQTISYSQVNGRLVTLLQYQGQIKSISEWAEEYQIPRATLAIRVTKQGWTVEEALTTPASPRTLITFRHKTQNLNAWAKELGFNRSALSLRLQRGWSVEKAFTTPIPSRNKA